MDKTAEGELRILERNLVRVCFTRLGLLCLLLIPLALVWFGEKGPGQYFYYLGHPLFPVFLAIAFAVNIVYLLVWKKGMYQDPVLFFRIQLITDSLMVTIFVLFTGGLTSGLMFLFWGLVFLYGRVLGLYTGVLVAGMSAIVLAVIGLWQYRFPHLWNQPSFQLEELLYTLMLQLLAMGLVILLLKMGHGTEERLLLSLASKDRALKRSEALKREVFDWIESGLIVCDPDGTISALNQQAVAWAGLKHVEEGIGRPLDAVFPELGQAWKEHPEGKIDRMEVKRHSGRGIFGLRITPIPEEKGALIIFTDITKVRRLEKQVLQMEKLASIGELAAGLAHEIKNPLAGIKASMQLMEAKDLEEEQENRLRSVVTRDIQRLDLLLSDFLAFARPSEASPDQVVVAEVVRDCVSLLKASNPDTIFDVDVPEEFVWHWDRDQLKQVLYNLMLNGLQAADSADEPRIAVKVRRDESGEYLAIRDNGTGVDLAKVGQLFDPFVTTKPKGSGLGLSIARRLAGQNGSWVDLVNAPHGGAEARVYKG